MRISEDIEKIVRNRSNLIFFSTNNKFSIQTIDLHTNQNCANCIWKHKSDAVQISVIIMGIEWNATAGERFYLFIKIAKPPTKTRRNASFKSSVILQWKLYWENITSVIKWTSILFSSHNLLITS